MLGLIEIVVRPPKEPVPDRLAVCGLLFASSVTVKVPDLVPSAVGVNVIDTVQMAPAANVFGANGQVEVCAKSPDAEMLEIVNGLLWLFCTLSVLATLVVFTVWPEKEKLVGFNVTATTPVPASAAVCGLVCALSVIVSVPDLLPVAVGVNVIEAVQLELAASVLGDRGQVEVAAKSPEVEMLVMVSAAV